MAQMVVDETGIQSTLERGKLVILQAIEQGNLKPVVLLLQSGYPVNEPLIDSLRLTVLMHTAANCDDA